MPDLRVFISSTFRDLHDEREHLVKKIFPEIRALCRERGVTFTDVDLRWGLTEQDAMLGQVIRTCLEEVDKCRPYFIGLIGSRYGWVPELHEILMDPDLLAKYPFVEELAIEGASLTEMEFVHGVFNAPESGDSPNGVDAECAFFYHRNSTGNDGDDTGRLDALIERARSTGHPFREFGDVEELGQAVRDDLLALIERNWPAGLAPSELELERRAHAAFAASRVRAYIPNPAYLKDFNTWLTSGADPLVIDADSGLGKSSLVAYLTEFYRKKNPTSLTIEHYVGASRSTGTAASVIRHVISEICERFEISETIPSSPNELQKSFSNWLYRCEHLAAEANIPVLLVVDAVNQLDEEGRRMNWLPETIPSGVKVVISTTPGDVGDRLAERSWSELPVTPLEDERVRQSIVVRYLGEFRKGITPEQLRRLISDDKARSPLYLRVVAEELRLHGDHESVDIVIDRYSGVHDLLHVFELMLERMERDYGESVVRELFSLIASSRSGLSEDELLELLGTNRLELSRLLFAFDYHLIRREGVLSFFHDYLRRGVQKRYLSEDDIRRQTHRRLAEYFQTAALNERTARERMWGYDQAQDDARMVATLGDLDLLLILEANTDIDEVLSRWAQLRESGYDPEPVYISSLQESAGVHDVSTQVRQTLAVVSVLERLGIWTGAIDLARQALTRASAAELETDVDRADVKLGWLLQLRGEYPEALERLEHAVTLYEKLGDRRGYASAVGNQGNVYFISGDYDRAFSSFERWMTISQELGDRLVEAMALGNMGVVHFHRGEHESAIACYQRQLSISQESGDRRGVARAVGNLGVLYSQRDEFDSALANLEKALTIYEELGDRPGVAHFAGSIGIAHYHRGDLERALANYERWLAISEELGDQIGVARAVGSIGNVYNNRGEFERALSSYERFLAISERLGNRNDIAYAIGNTGNAYYYLGRYEEALRCLERATLEHRDLGLRHQIAFWLSRRSQLLLDLVDTEETMPDFLPSHVPGLRAPDDQQPFVDDSDGRDAHWKSTVLAESRALAIECLEISNKAERTQVGFTAQLLLLRIDAAEGRVDEARSRLIQMLSEHTASPTAHEPNNPATEQVAELHYWLWKLGATDADHRTDAQRLYRSLVEQTPRYEYKRYIAELEHTPDSSQ